jgi:hypothetical protein
MSRAALIRAEGTVVTSTLGTSLVLINQFNSNSNQYEPREITVANLIAGGSDTPLLNLGASGTAGTLNIFPATASKGNLQLVATNNTGNTITTITNAAMGQASVVSVPDPGNATAAFVLDHGNQTILGNKTFSGTTQANTLNVGASGTVGSLSLFSATASKGSWNFAPVDNTGNTVMTITNAVQGGAHTYTIPDSAAAASFLMQNKGTGTEASNAVTINNLAGVITTSSLTVAGAATYVITLTNSYIATGSIVLLSIAGGTNTATFNITSKVVSGSGSAVITLYNNTAATALNGTLILNFFVIP